MEQYEETEFCGMPIPTKSNFNYIPSYMPSIDVYMSMLCANHVDVCNHYIFTRHSPVKVNRATIGSNSGPLNLTIPLVKPAEISQCSIDNLTISDHGNWEHVHWGAIFSSYGKAPFFEHLAPLLYPIYKCRNTDNFLDFVNQINTVIENFISWNDGIDHDITPLSPYLSPYYQIWDNTSYGFIPSLSIIDIAMHLGPETLPHMLFKSK